MKLSSMLLCVIMVGTVVQVADAQSGPQVPCVGCDTRTARITPTEGMWYNPEQSGSGFMFDVQNGRLAGAWYGYDAQGNPTWLLFSGPLVPGDNPQIQWTVDADLEKYSGGSCANCPYQPPSANEKVGRIHLEFYQMNHGAMRINDGEMQYVVPVSFDGRTRVDIQEPTYKLPDIYGQWLFVFKRVDDRFDLGLPYAPWDYWPLLVQISHLKKTNIPQRNNPYLALISLALMPYEEFGVGSVYCYEPTSESAAYCELKWPKFEPIPSDYYMYFKIPLANISGDRMFGESEEGHYFTAYRISNTRGTEYPDSD